MRFRFAHPKRLLCLPIFHYCSTHVKRIHTLDYFQTRVKRLLSPHFPLFYNTYKNLPLLFNTYALTVRNASAWGKTSRSGTKGTRRQRTRNQGPLAAAEGTRTGAAAGSRAKSRPSLRRRGPMLPVGLLRTWCTRCAVLPVSMSCGKYIHSPYTLSLLLLPVLERGISSCLSYRSRLNISLLRRVLHTEADSTSPYSVVSF